MLKSTIIPVAYGLRQGAVAGVDIETDQQAVSDPELDTVTPLLAPQNQGGLFEWLQELKSKRVIFNPGGLKTQS